MIGREMDHWLSMFKTYYFSSSLLKHWNYARYAVGFYTYLSLYSVRYLILAKTGIILLFGLQDYSTLGLPCDAKDNW